ncbi:ribonucleoprotein [Nitrosopumilus sp.]|nr:ribonucleoprotein [Nitrosopumilus sp.]
MADEISTAMTGCQGKTVLLRLRNSKTVQGTLIDFDIHMNLTLDNAEDISEENHVNLGKVLLRGDNIFAISLPTDKS